VASLHTGTDFLNNPVLDMAKEKVFKYGLAGVVIGLIIGLIIGMLVGRRRASA
jgi:ABC-type dipeptide/oligopeptide/nickel transport system permease subunit